MIIKKDFGVFEKNKLKKIKKEVIQPQVPLRLPCDDLTLLTELRFDTVKITGPHLNPARVV
jgi:hypothetical protein